MRLVIITINYNSSGSTIKLLKSLSEQTSQGFQTIVIDNASEETDFNKLQEFTSTSNITSNTSNNLSNNLSTSQVERLKIIRNEQNLGFSGGNNVGIKEALRQSLGQGHQNSLEWVLLLNNDTWAEPSFIASLRPILEQKGGIMGIPLVEGDKMAPSIRIRTSYCGKIEWLKPTLRHQLSIVNCPTNGEARQERQLSTIYVIGGGMAIHKSVFDKIGLLDEKYFLYFEDADYTVRARKAGIPISIASSVMIYHNGSSSTKKLGSPLLLRYHYRNALYFNWKNGPWYIKLAVWPWSWWVITKQILKIMIYRNREQSLAILRGIADFYNKKYDKI